MGYFCKTCQASIKYKSPSGWIDHVKGAKHRKKAYAIKNGETLSLDALLEQPGIREALTPDELSALRRAPTHASSREFKAYIDALLYPEPPQAQTNRQ
ncbi:hypothetical protein NEDG_00758 [Nematocida displodere]|uniref:Uncharacterized protein n=1 Tax=Nematocida displodere TaxID=1805483 RepID=A0A177ECE9_9MICR|nr:hypothetical protein NEDG_00758 [Nematocida displodere]